jgi:hypothetical protein
VIGGSALADYQFSGDLLIGMPACHKRSDVPLAGCECFAAQLTFDLSDARHAAHTIAPATARAPPRFARLGGQKYRRRDQDVAQHDCRKNVCGFAHLRFGSALLAVSWHLACLYRRRLRRLRQLFSKKFGGDGNGTTRRAKLRRRRGVHWLRDYGNRSNDAHLVSRL